jgi:hypothetical protein
VLPDVEAHPYAVLLWFLGEAAPPWESPADDDLPPSLWLQNAHPTQLYREINFRMRMVRELERALRTAEVDGDDAQAQVVRNLIANQEGHVAALRSATALPESLRVVGIAGQPEAQDG